MAVILLFLQTFAYDVQRAHVLKINVSLTDTVMQLKKAVICLLKFSQLSELKMDGTCVSYKEALQRCTILIKREGRCLVGDSKSLGECGLRDDCELIATFDVPFVSLFTSVAVALNDRTVHTPFVVWSSSKHSFWLIFKKQGIRGSITCEDLSSEEKSFARMPYPARTMQSICLSRTLSSSSSSTSSLTPIVLYGQLFSQEEKVINNFALVVSRDDLIEDILLEARLHKNTTIYKKPSWELVAKSPYFSVSECGLCDGDELFFGALQIGTTLQEELNNVEVLGSRIKKVINENDNSFHIVFEIPPVLTEEEISQSFSEDDSSNLFRGVRAHVKIEDLTPAEKQKSQAVARNSLVDHRFTPEHEIFFSERFFATENSAIVQKQARLRRAVNDVIKHEVSLNHALYPKTMTCHVCTKTGHKEKCPKMYGDYLSKLCINCQHPLKVHDEVGNPRELEKFLAKKAPETDRLEKAMEDAREDLGARNNLWKDELNLLHEIKFPLYNKLEILKLIVLYYREGDGKWFWEQVVTRSGNREIPVRVLADDLAALFVDQVPLREVFHVVDFCIAPVGIHGRPSVVTQENFIRFVRAFAPFETSVRTAANGLLRYYQVADNFGFVFRVEPLLNFHTTRVALKNHEYCFYLAPADEDPGVLLQTPYKTHRLERKENRWVCDTLSGLNTNSTVELADLLQEREQPPPFFHSINISELQQPPCCYVPSISPYAISWQNPQADRNLKILSIITTQARKKWLGVNYFYRNNNWHTSH